MICGWLAGWLWSEVAVLCWLSGLGLAGAAGLVDFAGVVGFVVSCPAIAGAACRNTDSTIKTANRLNMMTALYQFKSRHSVGDPLRFPASYR